MPDPGPRPRARLRPRPGAVVLLAAVLGASLLGVAPAAGADPGGGAGAATAVPGGAEPVAPPLRRQVRLVANEAADQCIGEGVRPLASDAVQAQLVMSGKLQLGDAPAWDLPADPTWAEDPYADANWVSRYHRLGWVDVLRREGQRTGSTAMLERYRFLMRDWAVDNPPTAPRSPWAYFRINAAMRGIVYLCQLGRDGNQDYMAALLTAHADYLAGPANYPGRGNYATWMASALMAIGCVTTVPAYTELGATRLTDLVGQAIDAEGVTDEGSVAYQKLNWEWWTETEARFRSCGRALPAAFDRVQLMAGFLAHALMPDGRPAMIGDTTITPMDGLEGTPAEWVRTQGKSGTAPTELWHTYSRGYAFGRSGWGSATRPAKDQAAWWMKFGQAPADQVHGHEDLGSLEYYAFGSRLIWDPGLYAYEAGAGRQAIVRRGMHNVVDVLGTTYQRTATAPLLAQAHTADYDMVAVKVDSLPGTAWERRILFSRATGVMLVDDVISQATTRVVVQRWNLGADREVRTSGDAEAGPVKAVTTGADANVALVWLRSRPSLAVLKGATAPRWAGWISPTYNVLQQAPTVEASLNGKTQRFTTLVVPLRAAAADDVVTYGVDVQPASAAVTVVTAGRSERLTLTATGASVDALPWAVPARAAARR